MNIQEIKNIIKTQIDNISDDSLEVYTEMISSIDDISPVSSFVIGLNTNTLPRKIDSNLTIITFESEPSEEHLEEIINSVNNITDGYPEYELLASPEPNDVICMYLFELNVVTPQYLKPTAASLM